MPKAPVSPPQPPAPAPSSTTTTPAEDTLPWLEEMPPRKIVAELDRYIVGQDAAKKAVAIAVRNVSGRRRWSKLSEWLRPKPPVSRQFGMAS